MPDYVIGVDLGGTNIRAGAVDYQGTIIARKKIATEAILGAEPVLNKLASLVIDVKNMVPAQNLKGVGFGIPGAIQSRKGVVTQAPNIPSWDGLAIRQMLQDRLEVPCFIENDANSFAVGEAWMGAGRGHNHVCCLTLGTGVGGGVIIEGDLLRGADGMAAELGHISVKADGALCNCGSYGCLETFASATGINRMFREMIRGRKSSMSHISDEAITPEIIYDHAKKGDSLAQEILTTAGTGLGVGIATLINIFNPEIMIVGGGIAASWDILMPPALETMKARAFKAPAARVQVLRATKEDDAGIHGGAYIAWDLLQKGDISRVRERCLAPWGFWQVLEEGPDYKLKRIYVHPGHRLSYQKHQQREETWMIATGEAVITLDGVESRLKAGQTTFVAKTQAHRIANPGPGPLVFVEVQRGTYFGEDDITRLSDDYKRT
jgi:glucokinase